MAGNKWAKARDGNEKELCRLLRLIPWPVGSGKTGARVTVHPIEGARQHADATLPKTGVPDLLVGCDGFTYPMEIKDPSRKARETPMARVRAEFAGHLKRWGMARCRALLPGQHEWIAAWTGRPVAVVETAQQGAAALGLCLRCGADEPTGLCSAHKTGETI